MGLNYPSEWKFEGVGFSMPPQAVSELHSLLLKIAEGEKAVVEDFKTAFGGVGWSSSYDWAVSDLDGLIQSSAANAATFVDSFWKCLDFAQAHGLKVPSTAFVNKILAKHGVPLVLEPPFLRVATDAKIIVAADPSPSQSSVVPAYVLKDEIGRGGYGIVYRACRTTAVDEFEYALKILDPSPFAVDYEKAIKRFRREVSVLRLLQHRSIVHYFEAGLTVDSKPYIVMQLIRGQNLRNTVASISVGETIRLFVEVLSGLHYAHRNDVIHRDLKPSNIIVRASDSQPIILDFGAAYILDQLDSKSLTTQAVGSIGYIPTEVLADPTLRSPLQDVYACGVMLYEILAGRRPDPANYAPLQTLRTDLAALDPIIASAIAGAGTRMTTANEFAERLWAAQQGIAPGDRSPAAPAAK